MLEPGALLRFHPHSRMGIFVDVDPGFWRSGLGFERRRSAARAGYDQLLDLWADLAAEGLRCEELITSGTPGFLCALDHPAFAELGDTLHRVSPGTVVLHDARSAEQIPQLGLEPAGVVFTRVVSHPGAARITCDAGSKSVAAEAGSPCAIVVGRPGLVAGTPSEEHLPFEVSSGAVPERGTELYLVPRHVCPTVNLAEEAVLLEDGRLLGTIAIAARSHDTFLEV
jgi:D-serine deaminase-like pyridoxal phosphate-dependent protein